MNLMTVEGVSKMFGEKVVLSNITFGIETGDKIGIIGINGTGKSTLLKILAGEEAADDGKITTMRGLRVGYLPQAPDFGDDKQVVMDYMCSVGELDSDERITEAKTALTRLGITDYYKPCTELSGGQRKRVALAAAMMSKVDVLILDEPTNHIDNDTVDWLEANLKRTAKALVMVTHDRYFLDRVVNKTIELDKGKMYTYLGNYTEFILKKAEREELEVNSERKRQSFLRTELKWVRRGAQARSTKQKARLQRFEEVSAIKAPQRTGTVEFEGTASRLGRKTIEADNISKAYDGKPIIQDFTYHLLKDDRIGIIGRNGVGKSTLLGMLSGSLQPDSGSVVFGETVKIGVFAQENGVMDYDMRVIDYIKEVGEFIPVDNGKITASALLERFLFNSEMQYSPIGKLSGGERRRLYLLRVLMGCPNILFLDEPTNDLDIATLGILEEYLDGFNGAVITVSHDRCFLDRVVNRIFALEGDGYAKQYEGGYTDYLEKRKAVDAPTKAKKTNGIVEKDKSQRQLKMTYNEKREWETIDADIAELEEKIAAVDEEMSKNASSYSKLEELGAEKERLEAELNEKMDRWVYLTELNDKIESQK
jgi:ATP-binding cassette subfamily F protein uup